MGQDMRCEVFNVGTLFRILMAVCVCVLLWVLLVGDTWQCVCCCCMTIISIACTQASCVEFIALSVASTWWNAPHLLHYVSDLPMTLVQNEWCLVSLILWKMSYLLASKLLAGFTYPAHGMSVAVCQGTHYLISHSYEYNTHLCNGVCLYNIVTNMFIMIQGNQ